MVVTASTEAPGLYIHIPFCASICPYCDFAVRRGDAAKRAQFVEVLCREIAAAPELWRSRTEDLGALDPFDTLYFGGGTPSLLTPAQLETLLDTLRRHLPIADGARLFFEANPEDVNAERLAAWRRLGVETLSLGVQAMDDRDLEFLGRHHTVADARRAIELSLDAGFPTVSVDLIYSLPHHTPEGWRQTLEAVAELGPHHLSCYELEIHERTAFGKLQARGELEALAESPRARLFRQTHRDLEEMGYHGYEVSTFAVSPEHHSRHNRKYWHHTPYLGLGPSAHSFAGRQRWWNERLSTAWEKRLVDTGSPVAGEETLSHADLALETLMLGFRTYAGVDLERFEKRFHFDLMRRNHATVDRWIHRGWLAVGDGVLCPTLEGLAVADGLAAKLDLTP